ncbi:baseplate J/gp47 family protein [Paenibacillus lautus]|uniref:baseplate assembly protein n=1 Tax=Paenibacillus lautus TaxID=1401 RepID=UPI003D2D5D49
MSEIKFIDDDPQVTINNVLKMHEAITGRQLYPADPERLFILSLCEIIVQQKVLINEAAKQSLLRYATGEVLEAKGEMYDTARLQAEPARTTVQFQLSMPLTSAVIIPAGTRIGPQGGGGELFFITVNVLEIKPGEVSGKVPAECSIPGIDGNGFLPGQLTELIDPIPFVQSVTNVSESSGGAAVESDEAYRERIRTAPESFSVAGPDGAYEYWAKTASSAIIDVGVESPSPVEVVLIPLLVGGELPPQEVLDAVYAALNRKVRPLTDRVTVQPPEPADYNIKLTYWISRGKAADSAVIQNNVEAAIAEYRLWQKSKLGRDINPSELIKRVMAAGALRLNVLEPSFTELTRMQVARENQVVIDFGGLADD